MIRVVEILKSKYFSFCVAKKVIICLLTGVKENIQEVINYYNETFHKCWEINKLRHTVVLFFCTNNNELVIGTNKWYQEICS